MEARKKVIVHINNISPEVMDMVHEKYPEGYQDRIFKVTKPNNDFFYAFTLDTEDTSYLIKVDVKIDTDTSDKIDEQIFSAVEGIGAEIKPEDEEDDDKEKSSKKSDDDDF
jgi:hypothetical protein